ncbi:MAG: YHS domain-containing protein [Chloroflexia bacterium]|nr:YHS domain-containing protein [Chloroflexia bacterium]
MTHDTTETTAQDPVCGMSVEPRTAKQTEYQGQVYYFCSLMCLRAFEDDPERYLKLHPQGPA